MMLRSQALLGGLRISTVVNLPWSSTCDMTLVPLDDVPGVASDFPSTSTSTPAADSLPAGIADLPLPSPFLYTCSPSPVLPYSLLYSARVMTVSHHSGGDRGGWGGSGGAGGGRGGGAGSSADRWIAGVVFSLSVLRDRLNVCVSARHISQFGGPNFRM